MTPTIDDQIQDSISQAESTGNVFADIGVPEPEEALAKAELARQISNIIAERGLTQTDAAVLLGIDQPKVSLLTRGRLTGFSIGRLLRFLFALDQDIAIILRAPQAPSGGRIRVIARLQAPKARTRVRWARRMRPLGRPTAPTRRLGASGRSEAVPQARERSG
jgi:predicted XRE-type DNA-binding protein